MQPFGYGAHILGHPIGPGPIANTLTPGTFERHALPACHEPIGTKLGVATYLRFMCHRLGRTTGNSLSRVARELRIARHRRRQVMRGMRRCPVKRRTGPGQGLFLVGQHRQALLKHPVHIEPGAGILRDRFGLVRLPRCIGHVAIG